MGLEPEQAERVLVAIRRLLAERYEDNQTKLGEDLRREQASVSQWISGKNKPGFATAVRVAKLLGITPAQLIDGDEAPPISTVAATERYPARSRALARLAGLLPPQVEETVLSLRFRDDRQPTEEEWVQLTMLRLRDFRDREAMTPEEQQRDADAAHEETAAVARETAPRISAPRPPLKYSGSGDPQE